MKDGIKQIVGKTISGVIIAQNQVSPRNQIFLTFSDGTYFEIWGDSFTCAGDVNRGTADDAIAYAKVFHGQITRKYPEN